MQWIKIFSYQFPLRVYFYHILMSLSGFFCDKFVHSLILIYLNEDIIQVCASCVAIHSSYANKLLSNIFSHKSQMNNNNNKVSASYKLGENHNTVH